jgi:phosphoglycerol transferase MdoB-like AlkP superfamily enzyme
LLMAHSVDNLISQITTALAEFGAVTDNNVQQLVITKSSLLGAIAMMLSVGCIISLMIARWWQALVFNPGGFQDEFHQFAIETRAAAFLVGVILLGFVLPREYQLWITLPAIPLLLAGLALIHHTVKLLQLGGHWLVIMYLGLLLLGAPLAVFLMGLAIGDSFLDLRKKLLEYRNRKH